MPEIKAQHVVSFSSEDNVHKADNLLKPETYRKWKCATQGEKQASVILQMEKASLFSSIEIGNEGSAFVEVLVSRSSDPSHDFQVLLASSSFMTPAESKQGTNLNRVRFFGPEKLNQAIAKEKWDRVKIVCSQPFNRNTQYGLSFIRFHSPSEGTASAENTSASTEKETVTLGAFKLKSEETDDSISVGSWFSKRSSAPDKAQESSTPKAKPKTLAAAVLSMEDEKPKKLQPDKQISFKGSNQGEPKSESPAVKNGRMPQKATSNGKQAHSGDAKAGPSSTPKDTKKKTEHRQKADDKSHKQHNRKNDKPLSKVLSGVVFVLSGFQNPLRSEIRDKALEMGAKYKPDWDKSCTHLICAFTKTPKFDQVKSLGGRIVKKEWIYDCYKWKKRFPWRQFKLGNYAENSSSEDVSDEDEDYQPPSKKVLAFPVGNSKSSPAKKPRNEEDKSSKTAKTLSPEPKASANDDDDDDEDNEDYNASTDVDEVEVDDDDNGGDESEGADTDDALQSAMEQSKRVSPKKSPKESDSEPVQDLASLPLPDLPDLFKKKHFFLYGDFPDGERRTLVRYIVGFNGILEDYMNDDVKYVITCSKWDEKFDEALAENDNLTFVRPDWIYQCAEKKKMVPYQPYIVVPS